MTNDTIMIICILYILPTSFHMIEIKINSAKACFLPFILVFDSFKLDLLFSIEGDSKILLLFLTQMYEQLVITWPQFDFLSAFSDGLLIVREIIFTVGLFFYHYCEGTF